MKGECEDVHCFQIVVCEPLFANRWLWIRFGNLSKFKPACIITCIPFIFHRFNEEERFCDNNNQKNHHHMLNDLYYRTGILFQLNEPISLQKIHTTFAVWFYFLHNIHIYDDNFLLHCICVVAKPPCGLFIFFFAVISIHFHFPYNFIDRLHKAHRIHSFEFHVRRATNSKEAI